MNDYKPYQDWERQNSTAELELNTGPQTTQYDQPVVVNEDDKPNVWLIGVIGLFVILGIIAMVWPGHAPASGPYRLSKADTIQFLEIAYLVVFGIAILCAGRVYGEKFWFVRARAKPKPVRLWFTIGLVAFALFLAWAVADATATSKIVPIPSQHTDSNVAPPSTHTSTPEPTSAAPTTTPTASKPSKVVPVPTSKSSPKTTVSPTTKAVVPTTSQPPRPDPFQPPQGNPPAQDPPDPTVTKVPKPGIFGN